MIPSSKHPLISELTCELKKSKNIDVKVLSLPPQLHKINKFNIVKDSSYFLIYLFLHEFPIFLKIMYLFFKYISLKTLKFFVWIFILSRAILKTNFKIKFNLIHAFWIHPAGFAAILIKHLIKIPVIISVLGYDISKCTLEDPLLKEIVKFTLKEADHVITSAKNHYSKIILLGTKKYKISVLSIPVSMEKFNPNVDPMLIRTFYRIRNDEIIIGFGPRISEFYGAIDFIRAASLVAKNVSNVVFMMIGEIKEDNILKSLEKYRKNEIKVIFTGKISYDKMPYYYAAMDIYCNLCYEGQGVSTLEAMSSKKPVIGYDVGDVKINDGIDGILVQPGNIKQLTEKILILIKDKELREKIAENARKRVLLQNNISMHIEKLIYIYEKVQAEKAVINKHF